MAQLGAASGGASPGDRQRGVAILGTVVMGRWVVQHWDWALVTVGVLLMLTGVSMMLGGRP